MKVRYTLRALEDLDAIFSYLDQRSPAGAQSVKSVIERRIANLAEFPLMAPETDEPNIRELTILRYPYKVYYEVQGGEVWIVHIRHAAREPWAESDTEKD
jgi:plasmid stabilization system protein ParE